MAEALLELDENTRIEEFSSGYAEEGEHTSPGVPNASQRLASRVVVVKEKNVESPPVVDPNKAKKKLAMENARKRKEERDRKVRENAGPDQAGVVSDRGGVGSGLSVEGVPLPHPAPANFVTPKVRGSRSPPRRGGYKSPSRVRTDSPRREIPSFKA